MREPPRCPYRPCPNHRRPDGKFFVRNGTYRARCRSRRIQRYRCRGCSRTFSSQTFRADRYDKKPHLNERVLRLLVSGVGFRQGSRMTGLTRRNYTRKARKIARTAAALDRNLQLQARRRAKRFGARHLAELQMDELHSYEECRSTRPVVIANVIETGSRFQIASRVASILPSGTMTPRRLAQIARDEARFGKRVDESPSACIRAFRAAGRLFPNASAIRIDTDERAQYPRYIRAGMPDRLVVHSTTPGSAPRGFGTPLHPINLVEAIARDHMGRIRRESWLVTKRRRYLQLFVDLHRAVKNWAMPRFNRDVESPAQLLGIAPRLLRFRELFRWRQDWGQRSPCPFGTEGRSLVELGWKGVTRGYRGRRCA